MLTVHLPPGCGRLPSQVVGQGLGDMPVVPELRFAPWLTRPRVPGRAGRAGATDPGPPLRCAFFHRMVYRRTAVAAGAGSSCLHEPTPPQQIRPGVLVRLPSRQVSNGGPALAVLGGCPGASRPSRRSTHAPGIDHSRRGSTPPRRTQPDRARLSPSAGERRPGARRSHALSPRPHRRHRP